MTTTPLTPLGWRRTVLSAADSIDLQHGQRCGGSTGHAGRAGTIRLFADADGATPIEELGRLEAALAAGADLAIGSRALASHDPAFTVHARWHRSLLGASSTLWCNGWACRILPTRNAGLSCSDNRWLRICCVSCVDGYAFDLELLHIAANGTTASREVPINWTDQPGSKVRPCATAP